MSVTERLLGQVRAALEAGRLDRAAPLLDEAAVALERAGRAAEATAALVSAARLRAWSDELPAALATLARAEPVAARAGVVTEVLRARAELLQAAGDGPSARRAWHRVAEREGAGSRGFALERLAELAIAAGDLPAAIAYYDRLVDGPDHAGRAERADALLRRASCRHAAGDRDGAAADLDAAARIITSDEHELHARLLGQRALGAVQRGDRNGALELALGARTAAVAAASPLAYLAAATLVSSLQLARGDEVAAYGTLVRARLSLADLLGDGGAQLVTPLVAELEQALGARMSDVHHAWAEQQRARRAAEPGR